MVQYQKALSMSRPLREGLEERPFHGQVLAVFTQAANLVDDDGRLIALTLSKIGNGPFSILLSGERLPPFQKNQPIVLDHQRLQTAGVSLQLSDTAVWEPLLPRLERPAALPEPMLALFHAYENWPPLQEQPSSAFSQVLIERTAALQAALAGSEDLHAHAISLVGLGNGLTPAGDDYLLGVMAGLWLCQHDQSIPQTGVLFRRKTTLLSAAFLQAATEGLFSEPWHQLQQALNQKDKRLASQALKRIENFGATSGRDALTGLAQTMQTIFRQRLPAASPIKNKPGFHVH